MRKIALPLIFGLLLTVNCFAQDPTQKGLVYVLQNFSGGLNTKLNPYELPPSQATTAENIRFNKSLHSISKRDNLNTYGIASAADPITGIFRHYMKDGSKVLIVTHGSEIDKGNDTTGTFSKILSLTTGGHNWQWVTWHNIAIGTDGYNAPVKYDGTSSSATYLGSCLATDHGSGSGPVTGSYTYKVTFYTASYEILFNVASNTITANGDDIDLSMIPIGPTQYGGETVLGRRVYRTTSNTSTYKLLSNGQIADNSTVTLTDSDIDGALGGNMPSGAATYQPPTGRYVLVQNNHLFFANDPSNSPSRIWYSEDGLHDVYINTSYLDVRQNDGDAITFIKGNLGLLTVGKNNTIQKVYIDGADPSANWSISDPFSYVGCQAPYSAVNTPTGIVYLAKDGLYRFNGQWSELISESVTQVIEDISPADLEACWGIYHNNMYHLAYTSETSGQHFNNRVLVLDFLSKAYEIDILNINAFTTFNSGNDWGLLYAGASDSGNVYAYSSEVNEVVHKAQSDFTGLFDSMRYIPTTAGGDINSPILEIARTNTIGEFTGTIGSLRGTIARQDYNGYYVSQPLAIGAKTFSKLYWNQTIPTAGSSVNFKLRTSPTGQKNLLYNDSFEFWDHWPYEATPVTTHPNKWLLTQGGTGGAATASSTTTTLGVYSAQLTQSSTGQTVLSQILPNSSNYRGLTMSFDGWIKSSNSAAKAVYFQVTDGATTRTYNYSNSGNWQEAATSLTISSTANTITTKCVIEATANSIAYFDQTMLVQGTTATNDWTAWSTPAITNAVGADISGVTANVYLQYLISMTTDDLTKSPNIIRQSGFDVRLTYNKEGAPQSTSIPLHYRTGYLDFGNPSRPKIIRSIETYHSGTTGNLVIKVENFEGLSNTWNIDTSTYPTHYKEYPLTGAFRGREFVFDITSDGTTPVNVSKIIVHYDLDPESGDF